MRTSDQVSDSTVSRIVSVRRVAEVPVFAAHVSGSLFSAYSRWRSIVRGMLDETVRPVLCWNRKSACAAFNCSFEQRWQNDTTVENDSASVFPDMGGQGPLTSLLLSPSSLLLFFTTLLLPPTSLLLSPSLLLSLLYSDGRDIGAAQRWSEPQVELLSHGTAVCVAQLISRGSSR